MSGSIYGKLMNNSVISKELMDVYLLIRNIIFAFLVDDHIVVDAPFI